MNENQTLSPKDAGPQLWERLADETPDAFSAFAAFVELGTEASLVDVAEKTGRTYKAIRNLSSRHHWSERAAAWRQHLANAALGAIKQSVIKNQELWALRRQILREQEWERSQHIGALCRQALNGLLSDPDAKISAYELSPLLRLASQTARTAIADGADLGADEVLDANSDPVIREMRAHMRKALAARPELPPAQPSPNPAP